VRFRQTEHTGARDQVTEPGKEHAEQRRRVVAVLPAHEHHVRYARDAREQGQEDEAALEEPEEEHNGAVVPKAAGGEQRVLSYVDRVRLKSEAFHCVASIAYKLK